MSSARTTCSDSISNRFLHVFLCGCSLFIIACLFKSRLLARGGYDVVSWQFAGGKLSLLQKTSLFAGEFWEIVVGLPLLLLLVGRFLRGALKNALYLLIIELELFFAFVHWATYEYISEFPSKSLFSDFFGTLKSNPDFLVAGLLTKRARLALIVALLWGLGSWIMLKLRPWAARPRALCIGSCLFLAVGIGIFGFEPVSGSTVDYFRMGPVQRVLTEMFRTEPTDPAMATESKAASRDPLGAYRTIVLPESSSAWVPSVHFSKPPAPPNVIFVVWETAGYDDYPLQGNASRMPNLATLLPHSLIAERHYSADVESIRSQFEIFSSLYEIPGRGWSQYFIKRLENAPNARGLDSLPRYLSKAGYTTAYYSPQSLWPADYEQEQLQHLGFQRIRLATHSTLDWGNGKSRVAAERAMYRMAVEDIRKQPSGTPFMIALGASIGHFPVNDIRSREDALRNPHPDRKALLEGIADFQDQMLGDLTKALRDLNILNDTILVITGDHGPRSRGDDPNLNLLFVSDRNFHVPLLIHYPRAFSKPVAIQQITAHIDLVPTVLDLMAIDRRGLLHEGLSMFDDSLDRRITFFLGEHLLSATALHYGGQFVMIDRRTHTVHRDREFAFSAADIIPAPTKDPETGRLLAAFNTFKRVQEGWVLHMRSPSTAANAALRLPVQCPDVNNGSARRGSGPTCMSR